MMKKALENYINNLKDDLDKISEQRRNILAEIIKYINNSSNPKLNFICTHNSRRSHLSQIWAQTLASQFGIQIETFSGGTEETAFHPNAVDALERAGFTTQKQDGANPKYHLHFSESKDPIIAYSKKFDDAPNPTKGFAAVMTCSEADAECPVVFGADKRIKLFYEDPKVADGTANEKEVYDERCKQIGAEMLYVFSNL